MPKKKKKQKTPLTATQVLALRQKHAAGRFSYKVLAKEYGLTAQQVRNIVLRFSFKDVP